MHSAGGLDRFGRLLYKRTEEADRAIIDAVGAIATKRGIPRAQVALWTVEGGAHHILSLRFYADEILDFLAEAPVSPPAR